MRPAPIDRPGLTGAADPAAPPGPAAPVASVAAADDGTDDGTVPDKQLSRWRNEGGAWLPED